MILKNGFLINPATGLQQTSDIRICDGMIREIGNLTPSENEEILDIQGLTVAPGLVDTHVHFRDPGFLHKETLHTGALAAAAGGFTTVICMANTSPVVDTVDTLADILKRAQNEKIHIHQAASVTHDLKGQLLADMSALKNAGACGFTDDGIPLLDAKLCYESMVSAANLDVPISLHEENPAFISENGINAGAVSGVTGSPAMAEDSLVARDCMLALHSKAHVVIQHISSKNSVAMVRAAKALGANIHAEATPHHFSLTQEALSQHSTLAKMNPPLRTEADRLAIIEGLSDGTIDIIATDHAPHSTEEKSRPLTKAPSGIIGLETSLSLGITNLVRPGHLTLMQLLEKMTVNPARLYHLPCGSIAEGTPADLVVFHPDEKWIPTEFVSRSSNSPFIGKELYGKIKYTICNGAVIYGK